MKQKRILFFSGVFLILGVALNLLALYSKCENVIKRNIKGDFFKAKKTIVYLVQDVQTYCRPCADYNRFRMKENNIIFFVARDFSDIDIENFRRVFEIRNKDRILRINNSIYKLINKCRDRKS